MRPRADPCDPPGRPRRATTQSLRRLALAALVVACATAAAATAGVRTDHEQHSAFASIGPDRDRDGLSDDDELRRFHTDPRRPDTDRDGLRDGPEIRRYHTNPRRPDTDHDGLRDGAEIGRYDTDPRRRDTDRDGLHDGDEIGRHRTNPLERDSDGDGHGDRAEVRKDTDPRNPRSRPGYPREDNTGVPAGTALSTYEGPSKITIPNTVIDGKTIGCIQVAAPGVVIRNSKISCPVVGVYVDDRDLFGQTGLLIEDSEIDCQNQGGTGISEAHVTARRVNIHSCENGLSINQKVTIEDSYIHDLHNPPEAHADGIQLAAGHWDGSSYSCCALDVTIRHNTIYGMGADGSFGTSAIISGRGGDTNILIENNLLAGGGYALYCEQNARGVNYRVIDNRFSMRFKPTVGFAAPATECADETQSGNVIHETGRPLALG